LKLPDLKSGFQEIEHNDIDVEFCDVKLPDGKWLILYKKLN
jgi:hypothetical protein